MTDTKELARRLQARIELLEAAIEKLDDITGLVGSEDREDLAVMKDALEALSQPSGGIVTDAMMEAGAKILWSSGITDDPVDADMLVVARIFRAMSSLPDKPLEDALQALRDLDAAYDAVDRSVSKTPDMSAIDAAWAKARAVLARADAYNRRA